MKTLLLALALVSPTPPPASAPPTPGGKVFMTIDEALELAFPDCDIDRRRVYLTAEQEELARERARVPIEKKIVRPYVATRAGELVGVAYFDVHQVRTLKETLMIVVGPAGRIQRVELLAFAEPVDYIPRGSWYGQFQKKQLDEELNLKRGIRGVTGATLTARATTESARRVLALHGVVFPEPPASRSR